MILIIGGVYQGKLAYATERFALSKEQVYFCSNEDITIPSSKKILYEIDRWILALIKADINVPAKVERFLEHNKDTIVICNDISCGIVPVDPIMRKWREETGRVMGMLAQHSEEVIRLFCGIPTKLK